tara:strand:+ start:564 stop:758 length:195 start_codon:yes stop_codon:yes gene_type:complete
MLDATAYIVDTDGVIFDQDNKFLMRMAGFRTACNFIRNYITNNRGKSFTDDWIVMGSTRIYTIV